MSFEANLERVESRHRELEGMLSSSEALNAEEITKISKELSELTPIAEKVLELRSMENELNEAKSMLSENTLIHQKLYPRVFERFEVKANC